MRFPFLASFIVFIIWLSYEISKSRNIQRNREKAFWEREAQANRTRRKSLDNLEYIRLSEIQLPFETATDDEQVLDCINQIKVLSEQTIVNLTGYSNTDLKLMYGAPNITLLTEYDQNYTFLVRTLQKWASLLYEKNNIAEAKQILEFAVSTRTDISSTYKLLASIYHAEQNESKIRELIEIAQTLNSSMKNSIVRTLQESYLSSD